MQPDANVSPDAPPAAPGAPPVPSIPPDEPPAPATKTAARFARPFELGTIAGVVAFDQLTKALVRNSLAIGDSRTVIPGFLDLTHVQNTGAAFGLLNAVDFPYKSVVMLGIAAIALIVIAAYGAQLGFHDRLARFGLALILGGAFGNLIDRVIAGHVVDFVDVYWRDVHFWAFNVADASISVGAILVLLDTIGIGRRHVPNTV